MDMLKEQFAEKQNVVIDILHLSDPAKLFLRFYGLKDSAQYFIFIGRKSYGFEINRK